MPVSSDYSADPRHPQLGSAFYDPVLPAAFPKRELRFRNDRWARRVGLDSLSDAEWLQHMATFVPLPDNIPQPLALRYHGHQFRHYNPDLGDGRGFLFAQLRDRDDGRLLDLGTKGSGQTPWSRQGDGRLTLKGGVREVLATELLEARGVYTSKTLSLVETGEPLHRGDEPSPTRSCVLVRLSHSHIRIGTFQRLAFHGDTDSLKTLIEYTIETYWPQAGQAPDPVVELLRLVSIATAHMAGEWYAAGFVHGVLNTDNTVVTGESFDYGPWRFLPSFDVGFTAAYFDSVGLYAFGRQPQMLHWNLQRLADCLLAFSPKEDLVEALGAFGPAFEQRLTEMTLARLGLSSDVEISHTGDTGNAGDTAESTVRGFYQTLHDSDIPFERAFFDLFGGCRHDRLAASPYRQTYEREDWVAVFDKLRAIATHEKANHVLQSDLFAARDQPLSFLVEDVEGLWSAIAQDDDWSPFTNAISEARALGDLMRPILPARDGHVPVNG